MSDQTEHEGDQTPPFPSPSTMKNAFKPRRHRRHRHKAAIFDPNSTSSIPEWNKFTEQMKESHHEKRRKVMLTKLGVGAHRMYQGYKGELTLGQLDSYGVAPPDTIGESPIEYRVSDDPILFEPFVDYGVGKDCIRIMCPDYTTWFLGLDKANVIKPIRRYLQQIDLIYLKDTPIFNVLFYIERFDRQIVDMLIDWLELHKADLPKWVDFEDDLDREPQLGKAAPYKDISPADKRFLDKLMPCLYKLMFKSKYYYLLLEFGRIAFEFEICPLQMLLKKYVTNLLHGKQSKKIWKLFGLHKMISREFLGDAIYFEYLIKANQLKLHLKWEDRKKPDDESHHLAESRRLAESRNEFGLSKKASEISAISSRHVMEILKK